MFVRAVVHSSIAEDGKIMAPDMAGKWICPMHPSVIKTQPGKCEICGMDLVTTESLGYVVGDHKEAPLVIPASAPLITGKRAVVYVQVPGAEKPTYEGREIVLGSRAGDYYIVKSGLGEGEIVVTKGNFKIDSALQIQAKPSMMSPEPGMPMMKNQDTTAAKSNETAQKYETPNEFQKQLWAFTEIYLSLQQALFENDKDGAVKAATYANESLAKVDMTLLSGKSHEVWMTNSTAMNKALITIKESTDIEAARKVFETLSNELITAVKQFGIPETDTLYRIHCPMAFNNKGADWLQQDEEIRNPYFGAAMPKCGEVIEVISRKTK
jgi:Cu(I)/Ag(I) efflux system membrane fusion protein